MSAVEDTREVRERIALLLTEVAQGVIVRTARTAMPYSRPLSERSPRLVPLDDREQRVMAELRSEGLVETSDGREAPVGLTSKGREFLAPPAGPDADPPAVPPLLCDGIHDQDRPLAVVVCIDSTDGMKRMLHCEDCAIHYVVQATRQAIARRKLDPAAPPAAVYFLPLPQAWTGV